jgi:hypothetical protein
MLRRLLVSAVIGFICSGASGALLGVSPGFPQTAYDNQGTTTYDAATGLLSIDARPIATRFAAGEPPRFVGADDAGDRYLFLRVRLDTNGDLLGGVPGDDFIVVGAVDQNGDGTPDFTGVLLAGEVAQFGFLVPPPDERPAGASDTVLMLQQMAQVCSETGDEGLEGLVNVFGGITAQFDFRIYPTSGAFLSFFQNRDCGLTLVSEQSNFSGSWFSPWMGEAKGTFGPIETNRTGACCLPSGECVEVTRNECLARMGTFNGVGVECSDLDTFVFVKNYMNETQSAAAGRTSIVRTTYNPASKRLTWEATFKPENGVLPNGFTLAINNGPNPNGMPGQLALFYFDCSGTGPIADPILTVYGYNGLNNANSFKDGDGIAANDPNPDRIATSLAGAPWVVSLTCRTNMDGTRTLGFDIDATDICQHLPLFPDPSMNPWTGAQFDLNLGFWFHPFKLTNTDYNGDGYLTAWERSHTGWVDVANERTRLVRCQPPEGACCLPSGECVQTSEGECIARMGTYAGDGSECEDLDTFIHTKDYKNSSQNAIAGRVSRVYSSWNPHTKRLVWEATYKPENGVLPNAFTQVINNGPNPNGLPGQLAIFYFETKSGSPKLTVYAYNGQNNFNSFKDGDGIGANDPNPDKILSSIADSSWVNSLTNRMNGDGTLTLGFDIDASDICAHMPLFPAPPHPWFGVGFNLKIGFWLHSFKLAAVGYDAAGCLNDWKPWKHGWLDVSNQDALSERCPRMPHLMVHYDFKDPSGDIVYDKAGDLDLKIYNDNGTISRFVSSTRGAGVYFSQGSSGRARIQTTASSQTNALREHLMQTDAVTVQVYCKQDGGVSAGSRIVTWSSATDVAARNFAVIGRWETIDGEVVIKNRTRVRTTSGTTDSGPTDMWKPGQPVVITFTYDGVNDDTVRVYCDGVQVFTNSSPSGGFDVWSQFHLLLGNEKTLDRPFKGSIYDVKIWDSALRPEEVAAEAALAKQDTP